jgi:hypothetical protein
MIIYEKFNDLVIEKISTTIEIYYSDRKDKINV